MSFQVFKPFPCSSLLCFLFVFLVKIQPSLAYPELSRICSLSFRCGNFTVGYPFWGGDRPVPCGHPLLQLNCENGTPALMIAGVNYSVLDIDPKKQVLRISRQEYFDGLCPQLNTTIDPALFDISDGYDMFQLIHGCPRFPGNFTCNMKEVNNYMGGFIQFKGGIALPNCNTSVLVPVSKSFSAGKGGNKADLAKALEEGFEVKWKLSGCGESCGSCGYDFESFSGICYCPGDQQSSSPGCPAPKSKGTLHSLSFKHQNR